MFSKTKTESLFSFGDDLFKRSISRDLTLSLVAVIALVEGTSLAFTYQKPSHVMYQEMFIILHLAASLVVILITTNFLLKIFIRQPLCILRQAMERVAKGDFDKPPGKIHHAELAGIAQRFTEITTEFREREMSLQRTNEKLQAEISKHKQTELKIKGNEAKNQALLNALPDMMFQIGRDGTILDFKGATKDLVLPPRTFIGKTLTEILPIDIAGLAMLHLRKAFNSDMMQIFEYQMPINDSDHYFEGRMVSINTNIALAIVRNISVRKRAEEENFRLEAQLRQAQKMEVVGMLAGGIAHDFNNILQAISGNVQILLMKNSGDSPNLKYLQRIEQATKGAVEIVKHLLEFSRKTEPRFQRLNLNTVILNSVKFLKRTIPKMIAIKVALAPELHEINADPIQMEQILLNISGNARDAMPQGGQIFIKTENLTIAAETPQATFNLPAGNYILLTITDSGTGMEKQTKKQIFEPFFTTKKIGDGTGLGLAIVYRIVRHHGGDIACDSEIAQGTSFQICLPANSGDSQPNKADSPRSRMEGGNETILMVDDEAVILEIAEDILTLHGYTVLKAESGEEALEIFKQKRKDIDLILMDLGMPGMGGELCIEKILEIDAQTNIIVISGYSDHRLAETPQEYGVRGFIGKPYYPRDLLTKIRKVLNGSPSKS